MQARRVMAVEVVAERAVGRLGELSASLKRQSRSLEDQVQRAAMSVLLNLGEADSMTRGHRLERLETAAGSAGELRRALRFAVSWKYLEPHVAAEIDADLDRVLAMLWRMRKRG